MDLGFSWGGAGRHKPPTPPPQQDPNPPPALDRKRRIDRILVPGPFEAFISQAYTTFLANSDHKALVVQLSPKTTVPVNKRKRCPVGFLKEEKLVEGLKLALADLPGSDLDWWQAAVGLVTKKAIQYEVADRSGPPPQAKALVCRSSTHFVPEEAMAFLAAKGLRPSSADAAYSVLVSLAEKECTDRSGMLVIEQLRSTLADPFEDKPFRKKQEVWRLVKQLQCKRKLLSLRNKFGVILPDAASMAEEIATYWQQTMSVKGEPPPKCAGYLADFFSKYNIPNLSRALIKPLSLDLVLAALDTLNKSASPGSDGVPSSVYSAFRDAFAPRMLSIFEASLARGSIDPDWVLALLNPIPKGPGIVQVSDLRPLVLQNTCLKWFTSILSLQLHDLILAITPLEQKGSIKGRFIFDHLWNAFGSWDSCSQGLFLPY